LGKRKAIGRRDRFDDEGSDVALLEHVLESVGVVEGNMNELVGPIGEKDLGEPLVAGGNRQA
jgi:hypothetical protein